MSVSLPMSMLRGHVFAEFRDLNKNKMLDPGDVVFKRDTEFVVTDYDVMSFNHLDSFLERTSGGRIDIFPDGKNPTQAELLVARHNDRDVAVVDKSGYDLARYPWYREPDKNQLYWTYQNKRRRCADNRSCEMRLDDLYRRLIRSADQYTYQNRDLERGERDFRSHLSVSANEVSTYLFLVDRYLRAESDYQSDLRWFEMANNVVMMQGFTVSF